MRIIAELNDDGVIHQYSFGVPDDNRFIQPYFVRNSKGGWDSKIMLENKTFIKGEEITK